MNIDTLQRMQTVPVGPTGDAIILMIRVRADTPPIEPMVRFGDGMMPYGSFAFGLNREPHAVGHIMPFGDHPLYLALAAIGRERRARAAGQGDLLEGAGS